MIFARQPFRHTIMSGQKTRHTVPRISKRKPYKLGQVVPAQTLKMVEGTARDSLGVHRPAPRTRKVETFERLHIVAVIEGELAGMTDDQARAEGFNDYASFIAWWRGLGRMGTGDDVGARVTLTVPVWVVYFQIESLRQNQFLADTRRGRGDYTTGDGIDEMQVIDVEQLDPAWAHQADARHADAQAAKKRAKRAAEQARKKVAQAEAQGIDTSDELAMIEAANASLDEKLTEAA